MSGKIETESSRIFTKTGIPIIIGMLLTGIGSYGLLPSPPPIIVSLNEKYPIFKWVLVYILILQGGGDFNEFETLVGTGIAYGVHKYLMTIDPSEYNL
jgi:hypothetical protein